MTEEQDPEFPPEQAFAKLQEIFTEQQRWSSLYVSLDEVAKDNKSLIRDLRSYDPNTAVPLIAGLLTVPKYQSNCLRLELLSILAWRHCRGKKKANIGQAVRWFHTIGKSRCALGEDPAEDVFVSLVIGKGTDYRILEGLWESSAFYAQQLYDVVQTMPNKGHWAQIRRSVDAILIISDIVCQNAKLRRFELGIDEPQRTLSSRNLPERNALVERVQIPTNTLEGLGIQPEDIEPFITHSEWREKIGKQCASQSVLHTRPLAILHPGEITAVLPSCISLAMRDYVIAQIVENGLEDVFDKMLANQYSLVLKNTPLLGGPRNAPVSWRNVGKHRVSAFGFRIDEGFFASIHLFIPSIKTHAEGGFKEVSVDQGNLTSEIQKDIDASIARFEKETGFRAGLILLAGGGWGKGYATQTFEVERENWHFESISIADLARISWLADMKPKYFWRVQEGLKAIEEKGVEIFNPNGILNLIGWVRRNDGHYVPHAQLPAEPITPDRPLLLYPPLNLLRDVRAEADQGCDRHGATDESGRRHVVQRPSPKPFFDSESLRRLYASMTDVSVGTLTSCYEGQIELWLTVDTPNIDDKDVAYRFWEMANEWLHRIGSAFEERFPKSAPYQPKKAQLVFLDDKMPDVAKQKPSKEFLESLCRIEGAGGESWVEITFGHGFVDGFRVAENIAERVVVNAMLRGFLSILGHEVSEVLLDEPEAAVVPNDDARSFHLFRSQGFMDYVRQFLPDRVVSVDEIDDGIAKLGLAWRARDWSEGHLVEGRRECTSFLNEVVDCLLNDIEKELKAFPRIPFITRIVLNIEKAYAEEDHWRRTSAAVLGLHGNSQDTVQKYVQQTSKFAGAGLAGRVLAEIAACMCPAESEIQLSELDLSRLISRTLLVIRLGGLSDAIRYNALKPELTLSPLGDILFKVDFGRLVVEPMLERVLGDRFVQVAPQQRKNYFDPGVVPEARGSIEERFWAIWRNEMGFDLDQGRNIIDRIEDMAIEQQSPILKLTKSELIKAVTDDHVDKEATEAFLTQFVFEPRPSWNKVPEGFEMKDIYPWRFGRRLSFVTRPIVQLDVGNDPILLVAPYSLGKGFAYVLDGAYSGRLEQSFFQTKKMRDDWWGGANEGHIFAATVGEALLESGWRVEGNVSPTKILNRKLEIDYGDVDVLAWREDSEEVLIIECKSLLSARNYSEIAALLSDYQGTTKNGKRDKLKRHLDRVALLSRNEAGLKRYIKKDQVSLVSCLCCNGTVPMQFSEIDALANTKVCSLEELLEI